MKYYWFKKKKLIAEKDKVQQSCMFPKRSLKPKQKIKRCICKAENWVITNLQTSNFLIK